MSSVGSGGGRAAGWRPCHGMELAAVVQDVRGLLYMLVDLGVPTPMKVCVPRVRLSRTRSGSRKLNAAGPKAISSPSSTRTQSSSAMMR